MRLLILLASFCALAASKPEQYKEQEDFQFSRSSSDDGSKSGYYGAQRGNMGGNYEKAHNMDSLAQHQMSTLVRNVDGELGEGANTRTGSVFSAANSRGLYGSGNFDLSNLGGRNFGEGTSYGDSSHSSQSALSQNSGYSGYSGYGSSRSSSSKYSTSQARNSRLSSGYQTSGLASQYSQTDAQKAIDDLYRNINYGHDSQSGSNYNYARSSQAQSGYENSNTASNSGYDNQKTSVGLVQVTPVRVYGRPGSRIAIPVGAQVYDASALQGLNTVHADSETFGTNGQRIYYKPSNAKHYESSYNYHKQWQKQDSYPIPVTVAPTESPIPANSELNEDLQLLQSAKNQYESELASSTNSHASSTNSAYVSGHRASTKNTASSQIYNSGSSASNAYNYGTRASNSDNSGRARQSSVYDASQAASLLNSHTGTADSNKVVEDISSKPKSYHSSYSYHKSWERQGDPYIIKPVGGDIDEQTSQRLASASTNHGQAASLFNSHAGTADSNNLVEDISSKPKSYHSSYSYHKSWERQGDPYVIKPVGEQTSQRLTSASANNGYACTYCIDNSQQRRRRSVNTNEQQSENLNDDQSVSGWEQQQDLGQQQESRWQNLDVGQETQNTWDQLGSFNQQPQSQLGNLEDLGQQTQNQWDNLEDLGQQTQNQWGQSEDLGQQTQNQWGQSEDLGQQVQNQWGHLEDLSQQSQNQWNKLHDLSQQPQAQDKLEDLGQQTQSHWGKLEDLGQQTQNEWDKLGDLNQQPQTQDQIEDMGQQTQSHWGKLENLDQKPQTQDGTEDLGQQTQNQWDKLDNLNQQTQSHHGKLEDLGQQTQNQWDKLNNLNQQTQSQWSKLEDLDQKPQTQNRIEDLGQQTHNQWDNLENLNQQTQSHWGKLEDLGQKPQSQDNIEDLGQQTQNQWNEDLHQQTQNNWNFHENHQTQSQWDRLYGLNQQTQNKWHSSENMGQQSHHGWSNFNNLDQQENLGQQGHFNMNFGQEQIAEHNYGRYHHQFYKPWTRWTDGSFVPHFTNNREIPELPYHVPVSFEDKDKRWNCHNSEHGGYFHHHNFNQHNFDFEETQSTTHTTDNQFNTNYKEHSEKPNENTSNTLEDKPTTVINVKTDTTTVNYVTLDDKTPVTTPKTYNSDQSSEKNLTVNNGPISPIVNPVDIGRGDIGSDDSVIDSTDNNPKNSYETPEEIESLSLTKVKKNISEEPLNLSVTGLNQQTKPDDEQQIWNKVTNIIETKTTSTIKPNIIFETNNINFIPVVDNATPKSNDFSSASNVALTDNQKVSKLLHTEEQQDNNKNVDNFEQKYWGQEIHNFDQQNMDQHFESFEKLNLDQHLQPFGQQDKAQQEDFLEGQHFEQSNFGQETQNFDQLNMEQNLKPFKQQNIEPLETQKSLGQLQNFDKQTDIIESRNAHENFEPYIPLISEGDSILLKSQSSSRQFESTTEKIHEEHISQNIELTKSHDEPIPIEPMTESITEKPGFWNSLWNKTKKAKDSVVSWFSS